ncbi:indole-3-acetate O-methyltransferase 1-like [Cryptomeria japonica]|uniref:indole-3-acetate O-methyltransferase 1-like n=1 Tax=Cryptomeria japonica TaxID=3369 RepID=UPI0027DAAA91|nr:indole-3-acetate O-methyltransferase 1-like [Cryptomeria japonica]
MELFKSQSKLVLENVLAMKGGHKESSYTVNSLSVQIKIVRAVKPILERSIHENMILKLNEGGIFKIADFGCATGWNTLLVADTIVRAVQRTFGETEEPEFEVYFVDLPSNDFNSLLRMMPPAQQTCADAENDGDDNPVATRSYFAAAVPESVQQTNSPHVYVSSDCEEAVGFAYLQQFDIDFTLFLNARTEETVDGGCVFISLVGRNGETHIMEEQGTLGDIACHFEYAFQELVNEGFIEKEKWESFNLPCFGPNPEEFESIVKRQGSFRMESVRVLGEFPLHPVTEVMKGEEEAFGRSVLNHYRALFENIVEAHFGCERLTNEFFLRIGKRAADKFEEYLFNQIELVVAFLIKK